MRREQSHRGYKCGTALVELAIVLSVLFMLVFGMIDFGLLLRDYLALSQVAREGVRAAAVGGKDEAQVRASINDWAQKVRLDTSQLVTTVEYAEPQIGGQVTVTLVYPHTMIVGNLLGLSDSIPLGSTMVMRRE